MKMFLIIAVISAQTLVFGQALEPSKSMDLIPTYIREYRSGFKFPSSKAHDAELAFEKKLGELDSITFNLARIKLAIINGDYDIARILLLKAKYDKNFSLPIQSRYLAILEFIQGNYSKSLEALQQKELSRIKYKDKTCLMETLNLIIVDKASEASENWQNCKRYLAGKNNSDHIWMDALVDLKFEQQTKIAAKTLDGLNIENERGDLLRLYLKLALYLNEPDTILERIPYLSSTVFSNPRTRELLGLLYYRQGEIVKAYNLIEDLSTPNSENIKGNLYLAQSKYELAYAQFKLALKRKSNSQNSLERILPTAWRLNQWEDGARFSKMLDTNSLNENERLALQAAFLTKAQMHDEARTALKTIVKNKQGQTPLEVNQLLAFNAFVTKDPKSLFMNSNSACAQKDGHACWIRAHMLVWEDLTLLADREDSIFEESEDLLKEYTEGFTVNPIKETVFINQKNIEELEDAQIELIPGI